MAVGVVAAHPLRGPMVSDANLGFDAALSGQGISLVNRMLALPYLADGQLVRLCEEEIALGVYYLAAAPSVQGHRSVARFYEWLKASLERSEFGKPS